MTNSGITKPGIQLSDEKRRELRERYLQEREKRVRPDGADQYLEPKGQLASFAGDPYTPREERHPTTQHVTVALIGGGFSGLCTGARLREADINNFRIIESGGDFGGVWYWNRYPGAMCDTASMVYLPMLEETGYMPGKKYVYGPEIREYVGRIVSQYNLYEKALFSTHVNKITWDEEKSLWMIETDRNDRFTAKYISLGIGPLDRPKLPGIPGIETFEGHAFHASRWDYGYTGGNDMDEPMTRLADKHVGIIGTGATSVQCVPELGRDAGELYVFQRTPSSIDERNNEDIDPEWFKALNPGWQREWLLNFATLQSLGYAEEDFVQDGWTEFSQRVITQMMKNTSGKPNWDPDEVIQAYEDSDDEKMEEIRQRVDRIVENPETAESLKAWYRQFCKRPCFHDEYLPTYNRSNVHLVDTDGKGVERIDANGAWVAGKHYPLDCIIYASGFEFNTDYTHRAGFEIIGKKGITLTERWSDGMESLHGMHVHGFPNMFIVGFTQGANLGSNITSNLSDAAITIAKIVKYAEETNSSTVECKKQAEDAWVSSIENAQTPVIIGGRDCTPGYYNNEGNPNIRKHRLNMGGYPLGAAAFFHFIEEWRNSGKFEGLQFYRQTT